MVVLGQVASDIILPSPQRRKCALSQESRRMRSRRGRIGFSEGSLTRSLQVRPDIDRWVIPKTAKADLEVRVEVLDLTPRPARVLANLKIKSIRQLLNVPKSKLLQNPGIGLQSLAEVERKVSQYLAGKWPPKLACQNGNKKAVAVSVLDTKALVDHMLSILPERERDIVASRYGLWDGKALTLASIGSQMGVSRERVRQIEARELRRLERVFGSSRLKSLFGKKYDALGDQKLKRHHAPMKKDGFRGARADDGTPQEAALAVQFLRKVWWSGKQDQQERRSGGRPGRYEEKSKRKKEEGDSHELRTIH